MCVSDDHQGHANGPPNIEVYHMLSWPSWVESIFSCRMVATPTTHAHFKEGPQQQAERRLTPVPRCWAHSVAQP